MPKDPNKKRYEVHFAEEHYKKIDDLAAKENRSAKNYLETLIINFLKSTKKYG